jgi:uncharacterized membrane protein YphA (DoxX/SURF4 family)
MDLEPRNESARRDARWGEFSGFAGKTGTGSNRAWAIAFARLVLGLIFFMAGCYKVFEQGPLEHARRWFLPFSDTFLPVWSLWAVGTVIPFVELVAGGLLLVGWRIRDALIALGGVLVVVTFGHLLKEPLYPFHEHVIPRLALLVFVLAMPRADDRLSIDHVMRVRAARRARPAEPPR